MNHAHIKAILEGVVPELKAAIDQATQPLLERIDALEKRAAVKGDPGEPGKDGLPGADGKSVTVEDVAPLLKDMVARAVSAMPVPKDGAPGAPGKDGLPGADGKSVTVDDVAPLLKDMVAQAVSAMPVPKDGAPGDPGRDGLPGADGKSVTVEDVAPLLKDMVAQAVSAMPVPKDGAPGADGRDGRDASDIPMLKGFVADEVKAVTLTALKTLSLSSPDDGRTLAFSMKVGAETVSAEFKTALVLDCGVWRAGAHAKGDGVTFGGSFWIAQQDTETKPDTPNSDWRLAVKRGRDGRDGKPGDKGDRGEKGEKGELGPRGFAGA